VNETEAAVNEVIDWIGSNTGKSIPHTCITLTYMVYSLLVEGLLSRKINVQQITKSNKSDKISRINNLK
jgi:hypothetical protein